MARSRDEWIRIIKNMYDRAAGLEETMPGEAKMMREKADEMLLKWEIDEAELQDETKQRLRYEDIMKKRLVFADIPRTYVKDFMYALWHVVEGAGMKAATTGSHPSLVVVGFDTDIQRMQILTDSFLRQLHTAYAKYSRTVPTYLTGMEKYKRRRSFIMGAGVEVGNRLRRLRKANSDEMKGTSTDLVLQDKALLLSKFADALGWSKNRSREVSAHGLNAGREAGAQMDIGQQRFGGGGALGAIGGK